MRICHSINGLHPSGGGPPLVSLQLASHQVEQGAEPTIVSVRTPDWGDQVVPFIEEVTGTHRPQFVLVEEAECGDGLMTRSRLGTNARRAVDQADIVHVHGIWQNLNYAVAVYALNQGKSLIMRPAGMLEPWALSHKRWKKMLGLMLGWKNLFNRSACMHATALQEAEQFRRIGIRRPPVAIIPNGVKISIYDKPLDRSVVDTAWPELAGKKLLLFLSRVHPKKGLINLAQSWSKLCTRHADWHLVIAGPDEGGHRAEVAGELDAHGARGRYTFTGPVYGDTKTQLMLNASLFVLPTFSENFGVVVVESLAAGVPVLTTRETPWQELETIRCGWWIDVGESPLTATLTEALDMPGDELTQMGERGRMLVADNYGWHAVAGHTLQMYQWLIGGGDRPDFITTA